MCPACWATLLGSYAALLACSAAVIVGTDRVALPLSGLLGALWLSHASFEVPVPWWSFPLVGAVLAARVVTLVVRRRGDLLVTRAWRTCTALAVARCPTKPARGATIPSAAGDAAGVGDATPPA